LTLVKSGTRRHVKEVEPHTDRAERNDVQVTVPILAYSRAERKRLLYLTRESRMVWRRGRRNSTGAMVKFRVDFSGQEGHATMSAHASARELLRSRLLCRSEARLRNSLCLVQCKDRQKGDERQP